MGSVLAQKAEATGMGLRPTAWVSGASALLPTEASDRVSFPGLTWRNVLSPRREAEKQDQSEH